MPARNISAAGIEEVATAIVANPTETWPEMRETLLMMERLRGIFPPTMFRATVYVLAALPGTPVYADIRNMHAFCSLLKEVEATGVQDAAGLPADLPCTYQRAHTDAIPGMSK